ncbi:ribbon-helix-helix domain-containing protein [Amphritea sp. 2_MG-2023]|jgi:predicted DNA-binding ribbon-helix-helix protein|uniref:ribbon-helix-helix domain-containing protein n=1 Tax=Amphritea TaxID=515417 RepID=UPI001C07651D|nr:MULTISPECIES: ribbon-helix-helix domain-containing protein [Amphritea]MBU2965267.1 ribbon-helix-helix domain-containing protein [Amphritea atlantica]MDO6420129.1 ribbon-helix-helix domain-containing protein [Amphritea sp. 2_MG-2023]MDX2421061.1 ribbon-helix-helix domain-containing protein [Amphritea sp.]
MCHIFAGQNPENYKFISRSLRLGGHSTSVKLEAKFWNILDGVAAEQVMSTPQFLSKIYDEALVINGDVPNFASLLRCACALYLEQPDEVMTTAHEQLSVAS